MSDIVRGTAFERNPGYALARVTGAGGTNITQASITSIAWESWLIPVPLDLRKGAWTTAYINTTAAAEVGSGGTLVVANSVYDTLQTGGGWSTENDGEVAEEIGYNFRGLIPATAFPQQLLADYPKSQWQRIDITFTPVTGDPFTRSWELEVKPVLGGRVP